jgi:tetratricopeptide (TPR) repeat protein
MTHPTEDELAEYAFDPDSIANRQEIEAHIAACPRCSATLTFIRSVDAGFGDREAWEIAERDASPTRETIRDLAARLAVEDEEAEQLLEGLLENPARTALANLGTRRKFLTAGVARRLLRAASEACDREPLQALTFADAAIDVGEHLIGYRAAVIHELRAHGWKERANALAALGQYDASLDSLDHAEREFSHVPSNPVGHAIVQHARAIVRYYRGEFESAIELLSESAAIYASLGETDRYMRIRHLIANTMVANGDARGARAIYQELLSWGESENDLAWVARESNTLGRCAYELGDLSSAVQYFHQSVRSFRELGMAAEALRPEWGFALVVLGSGKPSDALARLREVREEFRRREMLSDEALVSLDMMDALHALGRDDEVVALASETIESFTRAGMLTSALTAFAYLKEAAAHGTATPKTIQHVRQFVSRLQREPALLFCPPQNNL